MGEILNVEANGVRLAYEVAGPADGPPLLLLHALGEDRTSWRAVSDALAADGWRAYAPDLRGHGASERPGTYSFELLRDDVLGFLDALGLRRVTVVSHSLGTFAASLAAIARPDAVRRLVLEEGPLPFPADPPRPVPTEAPGEPTPYDWRLLPAVAAQRNDPDPAWWRDLTAITAPTLLVAGGPSSHLRQDQLARVAGRIPDCRLATIEAGHMIHDDRPAEFLREVRAFLSPVPAGRPADGTRG
ncbi:alpha/beta fold hydrolase [Streptomyces sp. NPDC087422]|uniref:alpha/beta fold hydrolase n=1 Tax=Streptomyces sp. NPDC087422 TaxID=3365786 RepID=UPI003819816E